MKYRFWVYLSLCMCLASAPACRKKSAFQGTVINSADGKPVKDVEVTLAFYNSNKNGSKRTDYDTQYTDENGRYAVEASGARTASGYISIKRKDGFAPAKPVLIEAGDCGEQNFVIHPYDSWLTVTVENTSNLLQRYKYSYTGISFWGTFGISTTDNYHSLYPGQKKSETVIIPGGTDIDVNLRTENGYFKKQTVFCTRHDTTFFYIKI